MFSLRLWGNPNWHWLTSKNEKQANSLNKRGKEAWTTLQIGSQMPWQAAKSESFYSSLVSPHRIFCLSPQQSSEPLVTRAPKQQYARHSGSSSSRALCDLYHQKKRAASDRVRDRGWGQKWLEEKEGMSSNGNHGSGKQSTKNVARKKYAVGKRKGESERSRGK